MYRTWALIAVLAAALGWAISSAFPPPARGPDTPPDQFSAARAFIDIEALAVTPRPVGSPGNARAVAYLAKRLETMGAQLSEQRFAVDPRALDALARWSGKPQKPIDGRNLIGLFPGRDRTKPALVLMAHHDSVWGSPGAADDAMGVAVSLEVARALRTKGAAERDLILLFTDSEEIGLHGADAFFESHRFASHSGMVINLEARGAGGRANMFETGSDNGAQMRLYADVVRRPSGNSLSVLIYDLMPNSTDYTPAKKRGIAGYNFAVLDRPWTYHSPLASARAVNPGSVQDMGDQALALSSALAFTPDLPARTPNSAFADLMGRVMIAYPADMGWLILLAAGGLIGAALWRTRPPVRTIGGGMILTVAMLLHGALLLTVFNAISGSGSPNYYDRLAAIPRLEIIAALMIAALLMLRQNLCRPDGRLLAIVIAMMLMWVGLLTGGALVATVVIALATMAISWFLPAATEDRGEGAILLLALAATVIQAVQPTAGPLFQWPLLLAAITLAARAFLPRTVALTIGALAAAIGLGHLLTQAHFVFLGVGAELPALLVLVLFAGWPLLQPLMPDHVPRWMPAIALAAALMIALWVRLDPMAPSVPEYSLRNPVKTKG